MSSSGYRRGGGYTRGRGRGGGGFNKPRLGRYWDNDDYHDKGGRGGKRRYSRSRSRSRSDSRSRSRSYSRSRSNSRSRSRSFSPRNRRSSRSDDYHPDPRRASVENPGQGVAAAAPLQTHDQYNPYAHQPMKAVENVEVNNWRPAGTGFTSEYTSQLQINGSKILKDKPLKVMEQEFITKQQKYQPQNMDDPSLTFGGYSYPASISNENVPQLYDGLPEGYSLKPLQQVDTISDSIGSKKKKEKRKKKKSRKRSSSTSSSSSSDSSSEESRRRRKPKRDSDDSSNSSSDENEGKHQKEKEKPASAAEAMGSRLTHEQRQALIIQQDSYMKKLEIIEREIVKLQTKEDELKKTRADIRLIEENLKLQAELKGRCKAVHIVLEKISNVLVADKSGADKSHPPVPPPPPKISESSSKPVEMKLSKKDLADVEYIDNGQHWCRLCNEFPETVEQMLNHFHIAGHRDRVEQLGIDDKPWNKRNAPVVDKPPSSARKLPLRGMQFFSPVSGWYCRLCNIWMGDQQCASVHLKSLEHNGNYMTFLDEHPEWEAKWNADRDKARQRALGTSDTQKSRFDTHPTTATENDRSGSIRVHMRNTIKLEDTKGVGNFVKAQKDSGIEEWMGKPQKVPMDVLYNKKLAQNVRQRHGAKKEEEAAKLRESSKTLEQSKSIQIKGNQDAKDSGGREMDKRRPERVELQISNRENRDRDRYRDGRGVGLGRRRHLPSRSRSRSRDRSYRGRRRSRSRSRSRDRRDKDKTNRGGEPVKKQMPIIGKMPLYKRPANIGKEKTETDKLTEISNDTSKTVAATDFSASVGHYGETDSMLYSHDDHNISVSSSYDNSNEHSTFTTVNVEDNSSSVFTPVLAAAPTMLPRPDNDLKPPGEKEAPGGTNLPDDLQQALDIIYRGGGKPITIPPPNFNPSMPPPGMPMVGVPPPGQPAYDYSAIQSAFPPNYMGYEPYQMSFDGYGASDMEEVSVAGNVPVDNPVATQPETSTASVPKTAHETETGDDDDIDDLRMLGIDVDDVAVVRK